ncbi:uncharacterized protein SETTUDRAFT_156371 [Exserohilum turcica Et28A]|uniref:Uncharacterized protein n=1 Tax=Exserohilum turcicum (strain 28A) TaxID=671987 RepID=R0IBB1_EXST2|nr:uncharacterized protein SETTUDRAFT_156371 [Exserohilum turcica Et28A]EOA82660.1 hypothetical protein SETTUDRAFT_156371 [Exserohilum turcica Et28A]
MFAEGSSERGVAGDIIEVAEWIQGKVANCKMRAGCLGGAGTPLLSSESSSSVANWVHEEHTRLYTLDSLVPLIAVVYAMPVYMRQLLLASGTIVPCVLRRWGPLSQKGYTSRVPCLVACCKQCLRLHLRVGLTLL